MKILLIKCSQNEGYGTVLTFPLGLMYIASYLRNKIQNIKIKIYDLRIMGENYTLLLEKIKEYNPDMIGISAITREARSLYKVASTSRNAGFTGIIVAGGPHPTFFTDDCLNKMKINYIVKGEGEETFYELVYSIQNSKPPENIQGIAYKKEGVIEHTKDRTKISNLNEIPFPAWDLIDFKAYQKFYTQSAISRNGYYMNIFTSRSCPYECIYCHNIFGKSFRKRSAENVIEEVRNLVKNYKIKRLEFVDDIFNFDTKRASDILDGIYDEFPQIELYFPNGLRCDKIDYKFLKKISRFKRSYIAIPVESASSEIQKKIKKYLDIEKVNKVITMCNKLRIYTCGYFMLGFPDETEEQMRKTIDFAIKSKLHRAYFFIVAPYKNTTLYKMFRNKIEKKKINFSDINYLHSSINISNVPDKKVFQLRNMASIKFNFNLSRIYRQLRDCMYFPLIITGIRARLEFFWYQNKKYYPNLPKHFKINPKKCR